MAHLNNVVEGNFSTGLKKKERVIKAKAQHQSVKPKETTESLDAEDVENQKTEVSTN